MQLLKELEPLPLNENFNQYHFVKKIVVFVVIVISHII